MGRIIKADDANGMEGLSVYNLTSIEDVIARMLADARHQRDRILDEARGEAERMRAAAADEGRREGLQQGTHEGRREGARQAHEEAAAAFAQETASLAEALQRLVVELEDQRKSLYKQAVDGCLSLACGIAERLVRRRVQLDPTIVETTLQDALSMATANGTVSVAVHPQDHEAAQGFMSTLGATLERAQGVRLTADESVEPGGCRITTDRGEVDAQLSRQIANIERQLLGQGSGSATTNGETTS